MKLTPEQVADIAHLARLDIAEQDVSGYCDNLSRILDFVAQLERVDARIEPLAHLETDGQRLRPDRPGGPLDRARYQTDAPAVEAGLYLVPRVIE